MKILPDSKNLENKINLDSKNLEQKQVFEYKRDVSLSLNMTEKKDSNENIESKMNLDSKDSNINNDKDKR